MTDEELKIQLALGSIKWWQLTDDMISAIEDIDTINMLYDFTCNEPMTDVFALMDASFNMTKIQQRKIELTGNLI